MRVRNTERYKGEGVQLQMTPMIDIVFQLLVFFIMTFKIIAPEGDFNVKMPRAAPDPEKIDPDPPQIIKVGLRCNSNGSLRTIQFGARSLGRDFGQLRAEIITFVGDDPGEATLELTEVEFDCDYNLRYEYVVDAITAVSGYRNEQGNIVTLVEKIKFTPVTPPGG